MNNNEPLMKHPCYYAAAVVVMLTALLLFGSCTTTRTVTVERVSHDTVQVLRLQRDSIFKHDSIFVREYAHGDTVFLQTDRWHIQYRDRWHHDSIYVSRRDSIPVPYPVEKKVPAELNVWQQIRIWLGNIVLVALAVAVAYWTYRKRAWWLRLFMK